MAFMLYGVQKTMKVKYSLSCLKEYNIFLSNLKKYIYFYSFSLSEIYEHSGDCFSLAMKQNQKIEDYFENKEDGKTVKVFLSNLGRTDKEEQLSCIDMQIEFCMARIEEEGKGLKEKAKTNLLFYSFIGVATTLVII